MKVNTSRDLKMNFHLETGKSIPNNINWDLENDEYYYIPDNLIEYIDWLENKIIDNEKD